MTRRIAEAPPTRGENAIDKLAAASLGALRQAGGIVADCGDEPEAASEPADDSPAEPAAESPIDQAIRRAGEKRKAQAEEASGYAHDNWVLYVACLQRGDALTAEETEGFALAIVDLGLDEATVQGHRETLSDAARFQALTGEMKAADQNAQELSRVARGTRKRCDREIEETDLAARIAQHHGHRCHEAAGELLQLARRSPRLFEPLRPGRPPRLLGSS